ncbi:MAG TPA: hypothetical protein VE818_00990 [Nitrososphaeraceae archaeon]|nr:hypothetical protein [Nitrososphaeraceae archaeon]
MASVLCVMVTRLDNSNNKITGDRSGFGGVQETFVPVWKSTSMDILYTHQRIITVDISH